MELGRKTLAAQHVWRNLLYITPVPDRSEGLEPGEDASVRRLGCGLGFRCRGRSSLLHGGALGFKVDRPVAADGGDVGVPEPPADRHQIDLRLQEVGGGGVLQHMRVQALGGEGRDGGGRHVRVLA